MIKSCWIISLDLIHMNVKLYFMIYNCFILFLRMLCDTILVSTNALCGWTGGLGRCGQWMRKSFRRGKGKKSTGPLSGSSLILRQITYTMICSVLSKQEYRFKFTKYAHCFEKNLTIWQSNVSYVVLQGLHFELADTLLPLSIQRSLRSSDVSIKAIDLQWNLLQMFSVMWTKMRLNFRF